MPDYEPARWKPVESRNNCYDYARNLPSHRLLQPGQIAGRAPIPQDLISCKTVSEAAIADGLLPVGSSDDCADPCWPVALVVGAIPGWFSPRGRQCYDFHWYRRDRGGRWSHKPGQRPVTDRDNARQPITDPVTANRWIYNIFCGFFCACPPPLAGPSTSSSSDGGRPVDEAQKSAKMSVEQRMTIVAEPLLFSGLRNPRATLSRAEESELRKRYVAVGRDRRPADVPEPSLGYSGVLVALEGDLDEGPLHALRVGGGVVEEIMTDGTVQTYADRTQIEDFLRGCIERHVPEVRAIIEGMKAAR